MTIEQRVDAFDIVERFFPYDGPYSPERTGEAATLVERLVRYLNNATTKSDALEHAGDIGHVISGLAAADHGRDQLHRQLAERLHRIAQDPLLYDDRRDRPGVTTVGVASNHLFAATVGVRGAARGMSAASDALSHLGHDDPPTG